MPPHRAPLRTHAAPQSTPHSLLTTPGDPTLPHRAPTPPPLRAPRPLPVSHCSWRGWGVAASRQEPTTAGPQLNLSGETVEKPTKTTAPDPLVIGEGVGQVGGQVGGGCGCIPGRGRLRVTQCRRSWRVRTRRSCRRCRKFPSSQSPRRSNSNSSSTPLRPSGDPPVPPPIPPIPPPTPPPFPRRLRRRRFHFSKRGETSAPSPHSAGSRGCEPGWASSRRKERTATSLGVSWAPTTSKRRCSDTIP